MIARYFAGADPIALRFLSGGGNDGECSPAGRPVIGIEGGYVNHPSDRGGPTRWGVTEQVARAYGYTGDMRDLPRPVAQEIFRKRYFEETGIVLIAPLAPGLAAEMFDIAVNMGTSVPGGWLQRLLNALNRGSRDYGDIVADGRIGTMTVAALTAFLKLRGAAGETVLIKGSRR
jgi:lysozyme family protein